MSPTQFTEALATIGWSQRHLAELLRCDTNLPTRWAKGTAKVPESIAAWLSGAAAYHRKHCAPTDWRVRVTHLVL